MTDRPIIFSGGMVRQLLAGTKTQTRRLLTPAYIRLFEPDRGLVRPTTELLSAALLDADAFRMLAPGTLVWTAKAFDYQNADRTRWQGQVNPEAGDRLYVRENWRTLHKWDCLKPTHLADDFSKITFESDPENRNPLWAFGKLRPCIHMPRWASRLTLLVDAVRVERLQEISEADAIAEGAGLGDVTWKNEYEGRFRNHRAGYRDIWNSLHGVASWEADPWVVALTFRVVRGNIDQVAG